MTKKRKKRRKLKIKNIMILLLILTTIGICIYYFVTMPIKNIYLKGNNIIPDNIIIEDSNINNYPSFLLTSNYEIEKRLKKNKYIEKVKVSKKIGNIIEIKITEYKPIAIIEKDNKIVLSSGEIVDNKYNIVDSPILTNTVDKNVYNEFINKFSKIENNILRQISQIEYNPTNVDKKRFLLYMNDSNMVYITLTKIEKINKYNKIKDKIGTKTGIIYLDSGNYIELKDNKS
ncbi:MAG: FtsQ-type POTRA domain-containing protein [Bacilli bacterium]|nr:FtsQ-type POTRA domain-containing protein [Bacilli bacterium]